MRHDPKVGRTFPRVHRWCKLQPRDAQVNVIYRRHHPEAIDPMRHSLDKVTSPHKPLPGTQRDSRLGDLSARH